MTEDLHYVPAFLVLERSEVFLPPGADGGRRPRSAGSSGADPDHRDR